MAGRRTLTTGVFAFTLDSKKLVDVALVVLLSLVWGWRMVMFQLSG